jgi:CRISPR-associated endonuclease Cas2
MKKEKTASDYIAILRKLKKAGVAGSPEINRTPNKLDNLPSLQSRVDCVLGIINEPSRQVDNMLFFIMYDIESNKVRYNVVKYLIKKGCTRIQKSIFLADLNHEDYQIIKQDLVDVQAIYDNHDSIILCPISTDILKSMKVIGQSINIDIITHNKNTLFF